MHYLKRECPFCGVCGLLGFLKCSDQKTIVVVCDECDSIWLDPNNINETNYIKTQGEEYYISERNCYAFLPKGARWASLQEIKSAGLEKYIAGESGALGD